MNEILNNYKDLQLKDITEAYSCTCQLITIKDDNPKSHGIGTRIDVITEVLRIKYGLNLPKSNILKVSNLS
jgi:hypothetical protein